ncbi:MAG: hypothetical protein PVG86_08210 [Desulfobacterales bacterium]
MKTLVVLLSSAAEKTWKKSRNAIDHSRKGAKIDTIIAPFILRVKMIPNLRVWGPLPIIDRMRASC